MKCNTQIQSTKLKIISETPMRKHLRLTASLAAILLVLAATGCFPQKKPQSAKSTSSTDTSQAQSSSPQSAASEDATTSSGNTFLSINSSSSDEFIGKGMSVTLTPKEGDFRISIGNQNAVIIDFEGFNAETQKSVHWVAGFYAPSEANLVPGSYQEAEHQIVATPNKPGLWVAGNNSSCTGSTGEFEVLEAVYNGSGKIDRFAANFVYQCKKSGSEEFGPALSGQVRFNSSVP